MTPTLHIEPAEKAQPLFLLYGNNPALLLLISQLEASVSFVVCSTQKAIIKNKMVQHLPLERLSLVSHIEEIFSYAVIFVDTNLSHKTALELLDKLKHDIAKVIVVISVRELVPNQTLIRQLKNYENIVLLLIGDLYGQTIEENYSKASKIIQNAFIRHQLAMGENSLEPLFPLYLEDALFILQYLLFMARRETSSYFGFYENPQTLISATTLLHRVEPELEITHLANTEKAPQFANTHSEIGKFLETVFHTPPHYITNGVIGFEKSLLELHEQVEKNVVLQQTKRSFRFLPRKIIPPPSAWSFLGALLVGIILYHAVIIGLLAYQGYQIQKAFEKKQYAEILPHGERFSSIYSFIDPQLTTLSLSSSNSVIQSLYSLLRFSTHAIGTDTTLKKSIATQTIPTNRTDFEALQAELVDLYFFWQQARIKSPLVTQFIDSGSIQNSLNYLAVQSVMPEVLGYNGEKTYLLLFQNNEELRPSGGFIGSVGIAHIKNGVFDDIQIQDVYDIDGQLKAHVEPHYIVRRFLQPHLYLRDSSFALDFEETASTSAFIYNLALKKEVDGVIDIDFETVRRVIEATGPLYLPDYDKTIDAKEAFNFIQDKIDTNFFPGSSQKKDILVALYNQLFLKLTQDKSHTVTAASLVPQLIAEKHIMFAFGKDSVQKVFTANNMSGSLVDLREKENNILYDVVGVNEANIGVNKVNSYLKRLVEQDVFLDSSGKIQEHTTLHLLNNADNAKPYDSYIRVITPNDSTLMEITIDDIKQTLTPAITDFSIYEKKGFKKPDGLEVDTVEKGDKKIYGFRVVVPANTSSTITVRYVRATLWNNTAYNVWYIKQPGTVAYPLSTTIHYPETFKAKREEWNISENSASKKEIITKDRVYQLDRD